jgi:hypothetical protein
MDFRVLSSFGIGCKFGSRGGFKSLLQLSGRSLRGEHRRAIGDALHIGRYESDGFPENVGSKTSGRC